MYRNNQVQYGMFISFVLFFLLFYILYFDEKFDKLVKGRVGGLKN